MTSERRDAARPPSIDEALRRSATHARNAVAEASLAAIALLDAISIPLTGGHAAEAGAGLAGRGLSSLSNRLADLARIARNADARLPEELLDAVLDALDAEIARWEQRSREDTDARAVLRAFLGLREILWEFGVRGMSADRSSPARDDGSEDASEAASDDDSPPAEGTRSDEARRERPREASRRAGRPRVQRIELED